MLTPRHQALLMTLAGMTVGVAVFGAVLAINGGNPFATDTRTSGGVVRSAPPSTPTCAGCLEPSSLHYVVQDFGTDDDPVSAEVPAGWKSAQDGTRPKFLDPTGVWQVRFDTRGSRQTPDQLVAGREHSIDERD